MSEIDFKEIEKAMAELVNKAQGKKREQQLGKVVRKRDEIAKKVETARGQGHVATKRIIIGNTRLRADVHAKAVKPNIPTNASANPISDFRPKPKSGIDITSPPPLPSKAYDEVSKKNYSDSTVGDLSNQYLQEQLSESSTEQIIEPDHTLDETPLESLKEIVDEESVSEVAESNQIESEIIEPEQPVQDISNTPDNLPESEELASSLKDPAYDYGTVHRIYGQRLPNNHNSTKFKSQSIEGVMPSSDNLNKHNKGTKKQKSKRGFLFYFVYFLFLASILTWAGAAYLYFIY